MATHSDMSDCLISFADHLLSCLRCIFRRAWCTVDDEMIKSIYLSYDDEIMPVYSEDEEQILARRELWTGSLSHKSSDNCFVAWPPTSMCLTVRFPSPMISYSVVGAFFPEHPFIGQSSFCQFIFSPSSKVDFIMLSVVFVLFNESTRHCP